MLQQVEDDGKSECFFVTKEIGDETIAPTRQACRLPSGDLSQNNLVISTDEEKLALFLQTKRV
jgi:hypothetical protein